MYNIQNKFLFNFSASRMGGGFKRLYAYAEWFNRHGGAWFIIHPDCSQLKNKFENNYFFIINQSKLQRLISDTNYLHKIKKMIGIPDLYYSYGIPIYKKCGKLNWFHLSNILPLYPYKVPLGHIERLQFKLLGKRIKDNFKNADIISAESEFSLSHINLQTTKKVLSVNGSDDELMLYHSDIVSKKENIATIIGTGRYKALNDSFHIFQMLQKENEALKLIIIGNIENVSKHFFNNNNVIVAGYLNRKEIIEHLKKTQFYISTTYIENSYNAASEGIFFAEESIISDIGPHKELLKGMPCEEIIVPSIKRSFLHVKRSEIKPNNLKTWDFVISDMMEHI